MKTITLILTSAALLTFTSCTPLALIGLLVENQPQPDNTSQSLDHTTDAQPSPMALTANNGQ